MKNVARVNVGARNFAFRVQANARGSACSLTGTCSRAGSVEGRELTVRMAQESVSYAACVKVVSRNNS